MNKAQRERLLEQVREKARDRGEVLADVIDHPSAYAPGSPDVDAVAIATAHACGLLIMLRAVVRDTGPLNSETIQAAIDAFAEGARVDVRPRPMGGEEWYRLPPAQL